MKADPEATNLLRRAVTVSWPTAVLIFAAIMVGVFTSVGMTAGFAMAAAIWLVGSAVGVGRLRSERRNVAGAVLLMLAANMSLTGNASAASPVGAPPVTTVCMDASGMVQNPPPGGGVECSTTEKLAIVVFCGTCAFTAAFCPTAIYAAIASGFQPALVTAAIADCLAALVTCWGCVEAAEACGDDAAMEEALRSIRDLEDQVDDLQRQVDELRRRLGNPPTGGGNPPG